MTLRAFLTGLSPCVRLSLWLQVASLPLLLLAGTWPFVIAWFLANHAVLMISGTIPRSRLLGANRTRVGDTGGIVLTFDDGPDPDITPRVLEILERYHVHATFFLIGERALRHPELVQRIIDEGHTIENHSHRHSWWFWLLPPRALVAELTDAQRALRGATSVSPTHFRAPAGVRSPWLEPVLRHLGLQLTSWTRRGFDTSQPDSERVLERLLHGLEGGEILLLHDGNWIASDTGEPVVIAVLPQLLETLALRGLQVRPLRSAFDEPPLVGATHPRTHPA